MKPNLEPSPPLPSTSSSICTAFNRSEIPAPVNGTKYRITSKDTLPSVPPQICFSGDKGFNSESKIAGFCSHSLPVLELLALALSLNLNW